MAHIGIVCPAPPGHLNPLSCVGRELQTRGHRVTVFHLADAEEAVRRQGLEFWLVGIDQFPPGSTARFYDQLGRLKGIEAIRYTMQNFVRKSNVWLTELPDAVTRAGIDLLLVDEGEGAGACVAERMGIPFVTASIAPVLATDVTQPPLFTSWPYRTGLVSLARNFVGYAIQKRLLKPCFAVLNEQRTKWGLPRYRSISDWASPWAHVSQLPSAFDFPRAKTAPQFEYIGPLQDRQQQPGSEFPIQGLTGGLLIYASMGTLQNRRADVFRIIAEACHGLAPQLVISTGRGISPEKLGDLPGKPLVVDFVPQLQLLNRAALTITHGGVNTVLDSLSLGVPLVAVPVANDQPGVAARIKRAGAGEILPVRKLSAARLRDLVKRVLEDPRYRENAKRMQTEISATDGVARAAQIIEQVLEAQHSMQSKSTLLARRTSAS